MRGFRYFLLGLALAVAGGALAIDTAGYPVNPTFQTIKVITGFMTLKGSTTGVQNVDTTQSANNTSWSWGNFSAGLHFRPCNDALSSCGNDALNMTRSLNTVTSVGIGNSTDNPSVTVNGQPVLKYAMANIGGFGGGCPVSSGNPTPVNVSACSRTAAGNYTVTISGFAHNPACFATEDAATGGPAAVAVSGTTSVQVTTLSGSGRRVGRGV